MNSVKMILSNQIVLLINSVSQGNDEDIGALGSILSWDDEDDVAVTSAVDANEAVDETNTLSALPTLNGYGEYPQQISIGQNQTAQQQYQMVSGFNPTTGQIEQTSTQSGQPQETSQQTVPMQPSQQSQQQSAQQLQTVPISSNQEQPAAQQAQQQTYLTHQQPMLQNGTASAEAAKAPQEHHMQQVQLQSAVQGQKQQQAMRPMLPATPQTTPAYIYQQQVYSAPSGEMQLQPTMTLVPGQPQTAQDPNGFLRQVQMQYQQVPGTRPLQHAPMMLQPQTIMAPAPAPVQGIQQPNRKKRKVPDIKPPAAPKSNVVSCSDTDGETKSSSESLNKNNKKASSAPTTKKSKAEQDLEMANMTPEEKAKANRDRNREHARNTRLRKKAYLEKLKTTVDELCRERDTLVSERAGAANLLVEMHNTRTEVLMSFFALRSTYEKQRELWSSILDESCFACVMPVTPYRSFPASEVQVSKCQRTVLGIDGMMADTASLHLLLNTLVDRARFPSATIQFRYTLVTEDAVVAGNQMMARWVMSTLNATQCGAQMEVAKQGMLCCKFNSAHKIIGLELMFDVMAFMLQLKQAAGSHEFTVVPNTVQTCQRPFKMPMVMTMAEPPYTIVQVNKLWEDMTGFKAENVVGRASCRILQGQETSRSSLEQLMSEVRFKRPAFTVLLNYTQEGKLFRNYLNLYPLSADSKITHYVALTAHHKLLQGSPDSGTKSQKKSQIAPSTHSEASQPSSNIVETAPHGIPRQAGAQQASNPPTQLIMQGTPVIPAGSVPTMPTTGADGKVLYYLGQPGILPKPAAPILQPIASVPTAIAPRTSSCNGGETVAQSQLKNQN